MGWLGRLRRGSGATLAQVPGPVGAYAATPLPERHTSLFDLRLLAVDIETSGLNPKSDHVLSVGFLDVDGREIILGSSRRFHVRPPRGAGVGQSATIHGLTDDEVAGGVGPGEALDHVLGALAGRALLVHFAPIETRFLGEIARSLHGAAPDFAVVDTMELTRRMQPGGPFAEPRAGTLRLWRAREKYGLPTYAAHNALLDALACAELYLALTAEMAASGRRLTLADVLC